MVNQFAVITGASSGIGAEYAKHLAKLNQNLILVARRIDKLNQLKNEIEKDHDVQVLTYKADLSKQEEIVQLLEFLIPYNSISYLINNAGFGNVGKFHEIEVEKHRKQIMVHINAVFELSYAIIPKMIANNSGVVINVASMAGLAKKGRGDMYGPTKSFMIALAYSLNNLVKENNIIIQAFCPGYTYTEFHQTEEYKIAKRDTYSIVPKKLWMSSEDTVAYSIRKLKKGKVVVIPGLKNQIALKLLNWGILKR